jgi:uncharacterized protein YcfJ
MNSKLVFAGLVVLGVVSQAAMADHERHGSHERDWNRRDGADLARVIAVEPQVRQVRYSVPVQHCWTEESYRPGYRTDRTGSTIVGGAVGALIGNQIGRGDTRRAATVGGAVLGAAIGSELARGSRGYREPRYEQVERCRTHHEERFEERVDGYRVTYVYNGRRQVTHLPYDPGRYLRVAVDVHPLG